MVGSVRARFAVSVSMLALMMGAGCSSPAAGASCNVMGFVCQDTSVALECTAGTWRALPCRGPKGCTKVDNSIQCDMSTNVAGDACASTVARKGLCTADGRGTIECEPASLTFVPTNMCRTCTVSGDTVVCQP